MQMKYFVDHKKKYIHERLYAGDACGFLQTPVDKREFTDSRDYVEQLEERESYMTCQHCNSVKPLVK